MCLEISVCPLSPLFLYSRDYFRHAKGLPAALVLVDGLVLSIRLVLRQVLCQVVYHMSHPAATGAAVSPSSRLRLLALPNSTTAEQTRRQPSTS
ncbi:uncharacterized protein LOC115321749 isoform X2 [Ixodes scapularis]|uniref:uncharacterized protein LOC115321749 isoform X2 n=1 Tax=Ixodes scapularis TaxID=6945 RepID=UPI001A9CDE04|nr:uncharacterized protein LOC115321749 isoform X2 [Ixodes scapularis]